MSTVLASEYRQNETGLLWPPGNAKWHVVVAPVQPDLFKQLKPLLIRSLILVSVTGLANLLPHPEKSVGLGSFVSSSVGLASGENTEMAQLIVDPAYVAPQYISPATGRTNRHPAQDFQFTLFSKSWIKFQY